MGTTIIQFGPPRSGSTLVYNLLKELFPGKTIEKTHVYNDKDAHLPAVVTYRHPLDSIASSLQRYKLAPTDENIEKQIAELANFGMWRVPEIMNSQQVLLLRYESFVGNYDVIFDGIERHFDIVVPPDRRRLLFERYSLSAIAERVSTMASFREVEPETHWHGDHISPNEGRPDYYKEFLSNKQIGYLKGVYNDYLRILDYD